MSAAPAPPAGTRSSHHPALARARTRVAIAGLVCVALASAITPPALARAKTPAVLGGLWRLDPSRTELPQTTHGGPSAMGGGRHGGFGGFGDFGGMGLGMGGGHRGHGGGEGGREGHEGGGGGASANARPMALPSLVRVKADDRIVTLADSTGYTLAEIAVVSRVSDQPDTSVATFDAPRFEGEWKGSKLVVTRELASGAVITDTWSLAKDDRELEVKSEVKPPGDAPTREFRRVFERVGD